MDWTKAILGCHQKLFEHLNVPGDRIRLVSHGTVMPGRFLLVMLTILAWLSISNHCALRSLTVEPEPSLAPMHCHGGPPAPVKSGDAVPPCCKILKAVTVSKITAGTNQLDFVLQEYPPGSLIVQVWQAHTHSLRLDTGPSQAASFSESVLQRSILANAPPFSLS